MTSEYPPDQNHTLEGNIGYRFVTPSLLQQALCHSSYANEVKEPAGSNERLEFLGDAVLQLAVSQELYRRYPDYTEGDLTRLRAGVVCEATLARWARRLDLGGFLRLGRGEDGAGGRKRASLLADAMEAVLGALYLDGGFPAASALIERELAAEMEAADRGERYADYKTALQERLQRQPDCRLRYEVTAESGPDHAKAFRVQVSNGEELLGTGDGKSKKEAEQAAAAQALQRLADSD